MRIRTPLLIALLAIVAMLAISYWGWMMTSPGARIPVHWGINGQPNGYMPKAIGLLMMPAVAFALSLLFAVLPSIEPRRDHLVASRKLYFAGWYGALAILCVVHLIIVTFAAGLPVDIRRWTLLAVGLLLAVLGNFMGKTRSTFFVGFRLPWSLSSELAWEKSNRVAGRGMVATGVVTLLAVFFGGFMQTLIVLAIGLALTLLVGTVVSFVTWKRDPNREDHRIISE